MKKGLSKKWVLSVTFLFVFLLISLGFVSAESVYQQCRSDSSTNYLCTLTFSLGSGIVSSAQITNTYAMGDLGGMGAEPPYGEYMNITLANEQISVITNLQSCNWEPNTINKNVLSYINDQNQLIVYCRASRGVNNDQGCSGDWMGGCKVDLTYTICSNSCLNPSEVTCGGSLDNGCNTGCSDNGGTKCDSGYSCTPSGCVADVPDSEISEAFWAKMDGNQISSVELGDTVFLAFGGSGLENKIISHIIDKKFNETSWPNITSWFYVDWSNTLKISSKVYTPWQISDSGTLRFIALLNASIWKFADSIIVSSTANNYVPQAIINFPVNHFNTSVNQEIILNQRSYDEDDLLKITWNFGNGETRVVENYSVFTHSSITDAPFVYTQAGIYDIELTAQEMFRTQFDKEQRKIYVFEPGINVVPVFTSPSEDYYYPSNSIIFNVSQSYVVNCTRGQGIEGFQAGSLYCTYIHAPNQKITNGYEILVNWTFNNNGVITSVSGNWTDSYNTLVQFKKEYPNSGNYNATVKLTYKNGTSEKIRSYSVGFTAQGGWGCEKTATTAFWTKSSEPSVNASNNCSLYANEFGSACCPTDTNICTSDDVCSGHANYCEELTTSSSCKNAGSEVYENSLQLAGISLNMCNKVTATSDSCFNRNVCGCFWNASKCTAGYKVQKKCESSPSSELGLCSWENTITNLCESSEKIIKVFSKATLINLSNSPLNPQDYSDCVDMPRTYPCTSNAKLSFFSWFNLIIALMVIGFTYFYFIKNKKI